jgi:hypothetical protein
MVDKATKRRNKRFLAKIRKFFQKGLSRDEALVKIHNQLNRGHITLDQVCEWFDDLDQSISHQYTDEFYRTVYYPFRKISKEFGRLRYAIEIWNEEVHYSNFFLKFDLLDHRYAVGVKKYKHPRLCLFLLDNFHGQQR